MGIFGLTDRRPENSLGRIEVSAFKGGRKQVNRFGKDLNQQLRLTTANNVASLVLKQSNSYGVPDVNGDFVTEQINIYLPYDEIDKTFVTSMKSYEASGLKIVCDRHTISKKCVITQDDKGNKYRPIVDVADPCPMRGCEIYEQCPEGCQKEGKLYFYVRELLDKSMMIAGCLTTHSYEDLVNIPEQLERIKLEFGSLTSSPNFPLASHWSNKIPFILTRTEIKIKRPVLANSLRTGKKADGTTWALSIQIDPQYMEMLRKWQRIQEMESRHIPISAATYAGLLSGDSSTVIDVEVISETPKQLPPVVETKADRMRQRIAQLSNEYKSLIGEDFPLPDNLNLMNEKQLIEFGTFLKKSIDSIKETVPAYPGEPSEEPAYSEEIDIDYDVDPDGRQQWQENNNLLPVE
jgi:hypothetical protein